MSSLQDTIAHTPLPAFFLIKNLTLLGGSREDAAVLSGELLAVADTIGELSARIPVPPFPEDPHKHALLEERFATISCEEPEVAEYLLSTLEHPELLEDFRVECAGESLMEAHPCPELTPEQHRTLYEQYGYLLAEWSFHDALAAWCNASAVLDREIFGESYTIVWVVPADIDVVVAHLMRYIQQHIPENTTIHSGHLLGIWEDFFDRTVIHTGTSSIDTWELLYDMKDALEKRLNALGNGPSQNDWDYLDELLLK